MMASGASLTSFSWDKNDFMKKCTLRGQEKKGEGAILAYTINDRRQDVTNAIIEKARCHMCDQGYDMKSIPEISCDSLGTRMSNKMEVMGGSILHEWT